MGSPHRETSLLPILCADAFQSSLLLLAQKTRNNRHLVSLHEYVNDTPTKAPSMVWTTRTANGADGNVGYNTIGTNLESISIKFANTDGVAKIDVRLAMTSGRISVKLHLMAAVFIPEYISVNLEANCCIQSFREYHLCDWG
eukprot:218606_1